MFLGTSEEQHRKASILIKSDSIFQEKGDNVYRILNGPYCVRLAYYPTIFFDEEKQEERTATIPFVVGSNSIFDKLAAIDKKLRIEYLGEDPKKVRSPFFPITRYGYVVFNRKDDTLAKKFVYLPFTVFDKLRKIQKAEHPIKRGKMENCFLFMWDVIVRRYESDDIRKKNAPGRGVSYDANFMPNNPFQGKIPMSYLDLSNDELIKIFKEKGILEKIFTEEELKLVFSSDFDISPYKDPLTNEELFEKLGNLRLNLLAKRDGNYLFPEVVQMKIGSEIEKLGLALDGIEEEQKALPEPTEKASEPEPAIVDEVNNVKDIFNDIDNVEKEKTAASYDFDEADDDLPF